MITSSAFLVDDVLLNATDLTGANIEKIYAKAHPHYAVYRSSDRVSVQYSDIDLEAADQRKNMSILNGLRTEINGLIDRWRSSKWEAFQSKAARYDGQVAAALVLCLEGDTATPLQALGDVKTNVLAERTSWGRFEYLLSAFAVLLLSVTIFTVIQRFSPYKFATADQNIWLAARAGAVGAFFSIALAISNRTVLTNMYRRDNIADASLRITIGIISAAVLVLLLGSNMLSTVVIAGTQLSGGSLTWPKVLIIGFVAGFLERLVPDLLAKEAPTPPPAGQALPAPAQAPGQPGLASSQAVSQAVLAPALDRLSRQLSLAAVLVDNIGPALPAGLLTPAAKDAVSTAKSAFAAGTSVVTADTLKRVSNAADALVTGSPIDSLIKVAAPMTGGSPSTLAALLSTGWHLGAAAYQRWQAFLLAAPVTPALIEDGTVTADEINSALVGIPALPPSWLTACARPAFVDGLPGILMSDDAVDQLWSRYGALNGAAALFQDREQINAGLVPLRLALLSRRLARDVTDQMVQPILAGLAKAADTALRPVNQLDAAGLLQAAAEASKASETAGASENTRAAFDALVTLVGIARQAKLDLPAALIEALP